MILELNNLNYFLINNLPTMVVEDYNIFNLYEEYGDVLADFISVNKYFQSQDISFTLGDYCKTILGDKFSEYISFLVKGVEELLENEDWVESQVEIPGGIITNTVNDSAKYEEEPDGMSHEYDTIETFHNIISTFDI